MKISIILFSLLNLNYFILVTGFLGNNYMKKYNSRMISYEKTNSNQDSGDSDFPLTVKYYGDISTQNCLFLSETLKKMDQQSKILEIKIGYRVPIKLHFQSHGGELLPSFYVCDLIKKLDTPVHIYIDGYVASAASLISVCGDKRFMTKNSCILIHQLKSQLSGKFNEMEDEIKNLNFFMNNLKQIYLNNSKLSPDKLDKLLSTDIWISADECLKLGLVDQIL